MGVKYLDEDIKASPIQYLEPEDKYRAAAREDLARAPAPNALGDYTRRLTQGTGMNWTDEAMAVGTAPLEMIRRGEINPAEAYRYTKAREDLALEGARERTGWTGSAVEALGGLASGGRAVLGSGPLGLATNTIRQAPGAWNAVGRYFGNVGKGATIGAVGGAGEGNTLEERGIGGAVGGVLGGALTAAAPAVIRGVQWAAQPLTNQFRRFAPSSPTAPVTNVDDIAIDQLNRSIERSGRTPQQIAQEVADANTAGQPLILAEGIGTEGQRKLAGIAKTPGAARQWIDEDLVARDLGRTQRAQAAVNEGLGMPPGGTADEAVQALTERAQTAARPHYQAAETTQPVWSPRMQEFFDHPTFQRALREGFEVERTRALAAGRPFDPADYAITQFNEAGDPLMAAVPNMRTIDLMKKGVDVILNKFRNPLTGRLDTNEPMVLALQDAQRAMLREVDSLNPSYAQARAQYAGPAQVRSAVEVGQRIPGGAQRPEDTIRLFNAATPNQQQGLRLGVADEIAQRISKGTETGPLPAYLRSPKGRAELEAMSLYQGPRQPMPRNPMARASDPQQFYGDPMRRALEREATMRQTLTQARGGSATAENAADMLDNLPPGPDYIGIGSNLMHGNFMGALRAVAPAAGRAARGETEAQRNAMARLLMTRDPDEVAAIMQRIEALQARRGAATRARAGAAGAAGNMVLPQEQRQRLLPRR